MATVPMDVMMSEQQVNQSTEDLRQRLERLEADNARLSEFVDEVFHLTFAAQSGNALTIATKVHHLSRKHRTIVVCPPECEAAHSPSRWARMLNVSRKAIYCWMRNGLKYTVGQDGLRTKRFITHSDMREYLGGRRHLNSGAN